MERMTIADRKRRRDEIDLRLAEIDTEFNGGKLSDEARSEWDDLKTERVDHVDAIEDAERREAELAEIAAERGGEDAPEVERATPVKNKRVQVRTNSQRRVSDPYDFESYSRNARSLEDMASLYRDGAKQVLENVEIPGRNVDEDKAKAQVERLLKTIDSDGSLARRVVTTTHPDYMRAFGKAVLQGHTMGLSTVEQAALARTHGGQLSGTGDSGGFAVPVTLDPSVILTSDGSVNPLRQIARVVQITTAKWQGVTSAGITVSRSAEAAEQAGTKATLAQPEVEPTRVAAFIPFSIEAQQDWTAMQSELAVMLQDAKDDEEVDSFVNGDGTGQDPSGVVATLDTTALVPDGGTFTAEDVYGLETSLPPRWRQRARFVAAKGAYNKIRALADSDGHDLWVRIGAGQPPEVLGYQAHELSSMDDGGTADDRYLLLGDFNQFIIVDRVGMSVELIPHLFDATTGNPTGERGIFALWRNSSQVLVNNAFRVLVNGS
jgi:HK97 family phage major capsid protein